jgi:hypothetical protein
METTTEINVALNGLPFGIKDCPSGAQLKSIKEAQEDAYRQLMLKDQWSNDDFTFLFYSRLQWKEESGSWSVPIESMEQLALDQRTPDEKALMLQGLIAIYRDAQSQEGCR